MNNQVYCAECRPAAHLEHNRASRLRCYGYVGFKPKKCATCSADFVPTNSRSKYCAEHALAATRASRMRSHRRWWPLRKKNPNRIVKAAIRRALRRMAFAKKKRSKAYAGYEPEALRGHIERLFQPGMTWANYGEWHIDHKKPLSKFSFVRADGSIDEDQVRAACALENLQPLWAVENLRKGAR